MADLVILGTPFPPPGMLAWTWLGASTLLSGALAVAAVVLTIVAMAETVYVEPARPLEPARMPEPPEGVGVLTAAGFTVVQTGLRRCTSLLTMHSWVLLSGDQTTVALVASSGSGTTSELVSQAADGLWIVTRSVTTVSCPPRRAVVDAVTGGTKAVAPTLALHRVRLHEEQQGLVQFEPATALHALVEAGRAMCEDLIDAGCYRWADPRHTTMRLTLKGALSLFLTLRSFPVIVLRHAIRGDRAMERAARLPPRRPPSGAEPTGEGAMRP